MSTLINILEDDLADTSTGELAHNPRLDDSPTSTQPAATSTPHNKQLYKNSEVAALSAGELTPSERAEARARGFFNPTEPQLAIKHENARHRLVIWMKARGLSNREISERTGYTDAWLSQLLRQPWARARLLEELTTAGRDELGGILASAAKDSLYTLIDLRDNAEQEAVRKGAADSLLDRFLGKPTQHVVQQTTMQVNSTDIAALDRQLAELEAEEQRLTHSAA